MAKRDPVTSLFMTFHGIPIDYNRLKENLIFLYASYGGARYYYRMAYPNFDRKKDARVTVFAKCMNIINSTAFGAQFMIDTILTVNCFKTIPPWSNWVASDPLYNKAIHIRDYDFFLKASLTILTHSAVESSFRDYIRAVLPGRCSNGNADFWSIYDTLLKHLRIDEEYRKLLILFTETRNTLHNNGIYYSLSKVQNSKTINYKGVDYVFSPYKPIEFTKWEFIIMLLKDCKDLLLEVVNHHQLISKKEIKDSITLEEP